MRHSAQKALQEYDAPAADFGDSGALRNRGIDAVRAVIVPPIALFFSLLGAIGHMAKLAFLLVKGAHVLVARPWSESLFARLTRNAWWVPVAGFAIAWACLSALENSVTQSRLYAYMRAQTLGKSGDVQQRLVASVVVNAMHVVAVGQGHAYPYNERIRNGLLGGISFGYQDTAR